MKVTFSGRGKRDLIKLPDKISKCFYKRRVTVQPPREFLSS